MIRETGILFSFRYNDFERENSGHDELLYDPLQVQLLFNKKFSFVDISIYI